VCGERRTPEAQRVEPAIGAHAVIDLARLALAVSDVGESVYVGPGGGARAAWAHTRLVARRWSRRPLMLG